ncbi:MAG: TerB family tellurite resistance protein [Deltaproteobacteria bacterium]|nr:TerB family tellurite resistance protein [Deltaproteobacteria bacterium]
MTTNEGLQNAWLKALAILAWADGRLDPQEAKRLSVDAVSLGGIDVMKIEAFFDDVKQWSKDADAVAKALEPLKAETAEEGLPKLRRCYELAMSDGKEDPAELRVIEQIASCFLPKDKADKVLPWLRASRQAALLEAELLPKGIRPPTMKK